VSLLSINKLIIKTKNVYGQFIRYLFVGGLAFLCDFSLLFLITHFLHVHYLLSAMISFIVGLIVNYYLSSIWVFDQRRVKNLSVEFLIFSLIGLVGLGLNEIFMYLLTDVVSINYLLSKGITTGLVLIWNFVARKIILFS
jgi:putative flippase GtrA